MRRCRNHNAHASLRRCERGAAAVEFALLLPFVLMLFFGILQFGSIFFLRNSMLDVGGELARRYAIGDIDLAEATTLARGRLPLLGDELEVRITAVPGTTDLVEVVLTASFRAAAIVDPFGLLAEDRFEARVVWRTFGATAGG